MRRWPSINAALGQCFVFSGLTVGVWHTDYSAETDTNMAIQTQLAVVTRGLLSAADRADKMRTSGQNQ